MVIEFRNVKVFRNTVKSSSQLLAAHSPCSLQPWPLRVIRSCDLDLQPANISNDYGWDRMYLICRDVCGQTPPFSFNIPTALQFINFSFIFASPTDARRQLCSIRYADATIHKCSMWSLLPTSLSLNPSFRRWNLGILELRTRPF